MKLPFYRGDGIQQRYESPAKLPVSRRSRLLKPEYYIADPGLKDACNVALLLGQPLLLTGEPGTGKTQFAYSLAWELGFDQPLKFETKSHSTARDLFYTYDALKRFQDAQSGNSSRQSLDYMTYQALGLAILQTRDRHEVERFLPSNFPDFAKKRSVILIDEIDKAPRDFPNDLLNELEQDIYFRIPEFGNEIIQADPDLQPIVIITSNSERDLPDAFLRRCIYYHVPFPDGERLRTIIANRLGMNIGDPGLRSLLGLFEKFRDPQSRLKKKPAIAELLSWILVLQKLDVIVSNQLNSNQHNQLTLDVVLSTLSSLIKTHEDQEKAQKIVEQWIEKQK
jgi:MoxR-like ATPase